MTHAKSIDPVVVEAYENGEAPASIGKRLGLGSSTVRRILWAVGQSPRRDGKYLLAQTITIPTDPAVLGYIAGLFDGEGHLRWRLRTNSASFNIYNTNVEVITWLHTTLGGQVRWATRGQHKSLGTWRIHRNRDIAPLLDAIMPYLIIKRGVAQMVVANLKHADGQ